MKQKQGDPFMEKLIMCEADELHEAIIAKVKENMPGADKVMRVSELFKVFGDITRVNIICALFVGEMCVCDIAAVLGMTQSAISHQLRILKSARLVKYRREGKSVFYSLDDEHISNIFNLAMNHVSE